MYKKIYLYSENEKELLEMRPMTTEINDSIELRKY